MSLWIHIFILVEVVFDVLSGLIIGLKAFNHLEISHQYGCAHTIPMTDRKSPHLWGVCQVA